MKKLAFVLALVMALTLCGCLGPHTDPEPDIATESGTDGEELTVLTPGCEGDTPSYDFTTPIAVYIGGQVVDPYVHFGSATTWDETQKAWLCADGLSLENVLPDIAGELPSFTYSDDYELLVGENVTLSGPAAFNVYTDDTYDMLRMVTPADDLTDLPEGSHIIVLRVYEQGDYIASEDAYEEFSYQCAYLVNKQ